MIQIEKLKLDTIRLANHNVAFCFLEKKTESQFSFRSLNSSGFEKNATIVNVSSITHILLYCVFFH